MFYSLYHITYIATCMHHLLKGGVLKIGVFLFCKPSNPGRLLASLMWIGIAQNKKKLLNAHIIIAKQ